MTDDTTDTPKTQGHPDLPADSAGAPSIGATALPPTAFGPGGAEPYPPSAGFPPFAAAPAVPPAQRKPKQGMSAAAALMIGALIGGASGAGVTLLATQDDTSTVIGSTRPNDITITDNGNATNVTAVAAQAAASVVTVSVEGGGAGGTGSGVVISSEGYIVTNAHVVTLDGAAADPEVRIQTSDGRLLSAEIIGVDPIVDLAVIKVGAQNELPALDFADSDALNVGDTAIAIGAPLGLPGTVTNGIVSALNRSITVASAAVPEEGTDVAPEDPGPFDFWNFDIPGQNQGSARSAISLSVIQTDAAINPGNSGGALLDAEGKIIGINVAIATAGGGSAAGSIGVGFAIPSNVAKRVATELIETGTATHGLLGASIVDVTEDPDQAGALTVGASVREVTGGAADAAGIRPGDVITEFNGVPITGKTDLTAQVRVMPAGAEAEVTFLRDGEANTVTVTLGALTQ